METAEPALERPSAPPSPASSSHYRAHLDGLRAIAFYLVVAFHAGLTRFKGGFIGVVVFFATRREELERRFEALKETLDPADGLWIAWPK